MSRTFSIQAPHVVSPSPSNVLLVQSQWFGRLGSAAAVRRAGARVLPVGRTARARHRLQNEQVDIALLDLDGPDLQADDILKFIHAHAPDVYVVAFSGRALQDDELEACFAKGFDDFLSKPLDADKLLVVIAAAADARRDDRARRAPPFVTDGDFYSPEFHAQLLAHLREETDTLYAMLSTSAITRHQLGRRMHRLRSGLLLVGLQPLADECLDLERDCELSHVGDGLLYRRGWRVARHLRALSAGHVIPSSASIVETPDADARGPQR